MARLPALLIAVAVLSHDVSAQQRLFVVDAADGLSHAIWEGHIEDGSVTGAARLGVRPGQGSAPTSAGGGQFVLWESRHSTGYAVALDRGTGALLQVPGQCLHVADPTRARLFTCVNRSITAITPSGVAELPGTLGLIPSAVSADGTVVFAIRVTRVRPPELADLVGIDADTGATLGSFPTGTLPSDIEPAQDGATVWVISDVPEAPDQPLLRGFAWPSGHEVISRPLAASNPPAVTAFHRIVGVDSARQKSAYERRQPDRLRARLRVLRAFVFLFRLHAQ